MKRARLIAALLAALLAAAAASPDAWPVAGRQGIIRVVIVPAAEAHQRDAYTKQLAMLCPPDESCFVNFYTNSTNAPLAVPLPDAIEHEPTALFRRSTKQGGEFFRWSCRMKMPDDDCF